MVANGSSHSSEFKGEDTTEASDVRPLTSDLVTSSLFHLPPIGFVNRRKYGTQCNVIIVDKTSNVILYLVSTGSVRGKFPKTDVTQSVISGLP